MTINNHNPYPVIARLHELSRVELLLYRLTAARLRSATDSIRMACESAQRALEDKSVSDAAKSRLHAQLAATRARLEEDVLPSLPKRTIRVFPTDE